MELNETKLANAIKAKSLRPAEDEEIRAVGAVPGYASPIGLEKALVVVDDLIPMSPNMVAGANEEEYHFLHVNYGRDYQADVVADIAAAGDGDPCPQCGTPLHEERGIEVGNIFKLGTWYSEAAGATYQDKDGQEKPIVMGSYGIGSGRLLASIVEEYHDEYGLILPISVAPYEVHLVSLAESQGDDVQNAAEGIYESLQGEGIEVLYDDRDDSPGVKFNDADLIGVPIRLTVGARSLEQGGVELKLRDEQERKLIPEGEVVAYVQGTIDRLDQEIMDNVKPRTLEK
jgi:prolyl-tRNA synthetase